MYSQLKKSIAFAFCHGANQSIIQPDFCGGGFAASRGGLDYKERLSSLVSAPPFNPMQWDAPQL